MEDFNPNWASPPGHTIEDAMDYNGISKETLALGLGLFNYELEELLTGAMAINEGLAGSLATVFGNSKEFWLEREKQYLDSLNRLRMERPFSHLSAPNKKENK